jgi:hypothetical protein
MPWINIEGVRGRPGSLTEQDKRIGGAITRGREVQIIVDGQAVRAFEGESVAAALLAAGKRVLRSTARTSEPRGLYCGIGTCFECVMMIDGRPNVRTCQTPVRTGMRVESQRGAGAWLRDAARAQPPRLIELFTKGCPACEGWLAYAHELAASASRYELRVWDGRSERDALQRRRRIARFGIAELPAIVVDGQVLACCPARIA